MDFNIAGATPVWENTRNANIYLFFQQIKENQGYKNISAPASLDIEINFYRECFWCNHKSV